MELGWNECASISLAQCMTSPHKEWLCNPPPKKRRSWLYISAKSCSVLLLDPSDIKWISIWAKGNWETNSLTQIYMTRKIKPMRVCQWDHLISICKFDHFFRETTSINWSWGINTWKVQVKCSWLCCWIKKWSVEFCLKTGSILYC